MLQASIANLGQFSLMCFQATKSGTFQIKPFDGTPFLCHVHNFVEDLHLCMSVINVESRENS
jgi:hypothetical protein